VLLKRAENTTRYKRGYQSAISIDLNHSLTLKPSHGLSIIIVIIKAPQPFRLAVLSFCSHTVVHLTGRKIPPNGFKHTLWVHRQYRTLFMPTAHAAHQSKALLTVPNPVL